MQPIPAQLPIIEAVELGETISVDAVPGGGKSTILKMIDEILKSDKFIALMFSNALAAELKEEFKFGTVSTLHAHGLHACRDYLRVNNIKLQTAFKDGKVYKTAVHEETTEFAIFHYLKQTFGLMKEIPKNLYIQGEFVPFNIVVGNIKKIIESIALNALDYRKHDIIHTKFDITYGNETVGHGINVLTEIVEKFFLKRGQVDFIGMLYIPVMLSEVQRHIIKPEILAIDESQDSNPLMQELYKLIASNAEQIIMLGDKNQTIHIWNHTSPNALMNLAAHFKAKPIEYSVSFRLPLAITDYLNQSGLDRNITSWIKKPGQIQEISLTKAMVKEFRNGDWVLGRFNKIRTKSVVSLETLSIDLLKLGKDVRLLGSDYLDVCKRCMYKLKDKKGNAIVELDAIIKEEIKEIEKTKGPNHHKARKLASDLEVFTLYYNFWMGKHSKLNFLEFLETMYADSDNAITLCTYHRAKGKEAERIFLMHVDIIYADIVNTDLPMAQRIEALNLLYEGKRQVKLIPL